MASNEKSNRAEEGRGPKIGRTRAYGFFPILAPFGRR